jgi:hypothetical protein
MPVNDGPLKPAFRWVRQCSKGRTMVGEEEAAVGMVTKMYAVMVHKICEMFHVVNGGGMYLEFRPK